MIKKIMNVVMLDIYPKKNYRISKDQNGGFGTANNYGDNIFLKLLNFYIKKNIDYPPLFAVQAMAELKKNNFNVSYSRKPEVSDYDLYILPSSIVTHESEIKVIKSLSLKGKKIFSIGPFATSRPYLYNAVGAKVISGESEFFFKDFQINDLNKYKNYHDVIFFKHKYNLDDLSYPSWDLIMKEVNPVMGLLGKGLTIPISSARGCPYSCSYYCTYPLQQGRKLRLRNPNYVVSEMLYWYEKFNVKNFIFRDPVFSLDKKHAHQLLSKIIETKIKFNICVETHLKDIDQKTISIFKASGVKLVYVGIESGDEKVLLDSKRTTIQFDSQIDKVKEMEKNGIKVKCMYILAQPSDNEITSKKTIKYSQKIPSTFAQFSIFTPYPGTPVYEEFKDKIIVDRYESYDQWQLVFDHDNLSRKRVRSLLNLAYLSYYLKPAWILRFLKGLYFK